MDVNGDSVELQVVFEVAKLAPNNATKTHVIFM